MATITNSTAKILNAIRNDASLNYQSYVPVATEDADSIRKIGATLMDTPNLMNDFINALLNRIAKVLITNKSYDNPWKPFKKGALEYGETIEDVFIELAKPFDYNPETAESTVFQRVIPDVKSTFYVMNFRKFYKDTIEEETLKRAFLSYEGVRDMISGIINSMYSAMEYDEFQVMKYLLARRLLAGLMYPKTVGALSDSTAKSVVSKIKGVSNKLEFMSPDYNILGVRNYAKKDNQYLIINAEADATIDVEVLASAFNMSKAEFLGHRVLVDSFGVLDTERLALIFAGDSTYQEISEEELAVLDSVPAVLVDGDYFQVYDNLTRMGDIMNPEGLYYNYTLHTWRTFAVSPFANAIVFLPENPTVTGITATPSEVTLSAGASVEIGVNVATTGLAPQGVSFTSNTEGVNVSQSGIVSVDSDVASETVATITIKSLFDTSVSTTVTVTVA